MMSLAQKLPPLKILPTILAILVLSLLISNSNQQQQQQQYSKHQNLNASEPEEPVTVTTSYGQLQGIVHGPSSYSSLQEKIDVFFGVPFTQAPVGILRFEKPLPPASWRGIRLAGEQPPACVPHARPESQFVYSEDCLFLNIFVPHKEPEAETKQLYPVLFVIHGGAFEEGSAAEYSNYDLLGARFVNKGIVFVAIQYRLGMLGFASSGDSEMPGNLGIHDQLAALRWIHENARAFGGDPNRVTVLGFSAGSGSTGLLSTTPLAKDYFHQTVRMSASPLSGSASGTFVPEATRELAKAVGCPMEAKNSSVKSCLREKSIEELFDGMEQIGPVPISYSIVEFGPNRADQELFPADYLEMMPKFPPKRTMMGFVELDFLAMILVMNRNTTYSMLALTDAQIDNYGLEAFKASIRDFVAKEQFFGDQEEAVRAEIVDFYVNKYKDPTEMEGGDPKDNIHFLRLYSMIVSDLNTIVPTLWEAQVRIGANWPIFLYQNKYFNPVVFQPRAKVHASFHGYDHALLFAGMLIRDEEDQKMSNYLIESVVNFVKNGDPSTATVKWEPTAKFSLSTAKAISHMQIDNKPGPQQKLGMEGEMKRLQFWMEMGRKYGGSYDLVRGIYGANSADADQQQNAAAAATIWKRNGLAWHFAIAMFAYFCFH